MARKTISIDDIVEEALREIQSKFIKADSKSWSLSKVVNLVLMSAMINSNDLTINEWNRLRKYVQSGNPDSLNEINTEKFVTNILTV